jgi:sirohydrochlorin cobaltochelatase
MRGLVLFAHGSTVESANNAVHQVTAELERRTATPVETAFLDCSAPTLADAVHALAARGVSDVLVVPYFLTTGIHLKRDLPRLLEELRPKYPGIRFEVAEPLDGHPALIDILIDRSERRAGSEGKAG